MGDGNQALLHAAERLDRKALKTAQTKARVALRAKAMLVIDELKERLADERQKLKEALRRSVSDTQEQFADARIDSLRAGTLNARIALADAEKNHPVPSVRIWKGEFNQPQPSTEILAGSRVEIPIKESI
jgi:hypothetical protein